MPVYLRILIVFVFLPFALNAQMTAPGSNAVRHTVYPSMPGVRDPVFIYCSQTGNESGILISARPGGSGLYSFTWFRWNELKKSFSDSIKTDSGVSSSTLNGITEGGYRIDISKSGIYDTSLVGWVFFDKPYSKAGFENNTCEYLALSGTAAIDTFFYKDPASGNPVRLPNKVRFLWSSNPSSKIPYPDFELNMLTYDPPVENVTYKLEVTDSFNCKSESTYFYESIHSKADFDIDPTEGEAPLEVAFTNKSVNASTYLWRFGDGKDSTSILENPEPHVYYKPGEYTVKLEAISEEGCIDSLRSDKIVVEQSDLDIPNVFTPDGDGYNDWFIPMKKSMRFMSVEIFSRSGMKVYGFTGEGKILREWQGWDGNVNNSSIKASPGVYFYLIRAYGWDDIDYDGKKYRGFVYLYR